MALCLALPEQRPVELLVFAPLVPLAELRAHEHELLARVRRHVAHEQAIVGALLPFVARHLVEQRTLAVHHFIVRDRQDEVLGPGVHERERDLVVLVAAVDRVLAEVLQRVVHPAHVPLEAETHAAQVHGARYAGKGGGFFGDGQHARVLAVRHGVELAQELQRLEVLAAAVLVRQPLARHCGCSRDRASRPRHRRARRRRGNAPSSTAHSPPGSSSPRGGRS